MACLHDEVKLKETREIGAEAFFEQLDHFIGCRLGLLARLFPLASLFFRPLKAPLSAAPTAWVKAGLVSLLFFLLLGLPRRLLRLAHHAFHGLDGYDLAALEAGDDFISYLVGC